MPAISVRELCAFGAKRGDLDLRFTPAPTAEEGIAAHAAVAARRGAGYQREIRIEHLHDDLLVRGRADGLRPHPMRLEEIKSHRGDLERMPAHHRELHWAQLKMYATQFCIERDLAELELALVYYDVDRQRETVLPRVFARAELEHFAGELCESYRTWEHAQEAHRERRNAALTRMAFPHADFHAGQRRFAKAIYRSIRDRRPLMAQAPTGIGKSIGSLFPALKAMSQGLIDKVYYLTAKTSGRRSALDALTALSSGDEPIPLRVLELVAREKCCEHPGRACHGQACPLANGFFDRLPAARADAAHAQRLDQASVRAVALRHKVCPYYLAQEMVRWADIIVGDYNYYFDRSAILHALMLANDWKVSVLVDEGHNLIDRARSMYSAEMHQRAVAPLRKTAPAKIKRSLSRVSKAWRQIVEGQHQAYRAYDICHSALADALRGAIAKIGEHLAEEPAAIAAELQRFYFDAMAFIELADEFGDHALYDVTLDRNHAAATATIRNVVPARYLATRIAAASSVTIFSATLNPPTFYRDLLGFPEETPWIDLPSPFRPEQLRVRTHRVSTRLADRNASLPVIADLIYQQFQEAPGNYLVFCSSFQYVRQLGAELAFRHPELPLITHERASDESSRASFLDRFRSGVPVVGLSVLGSIFAEGIDLPGEQLIGVFIVTLGLPEPSEVNEEMRSRMSSIVGAAAYDYTYLFPALQKVVQAGGRVIRGMSDTGVLHLIDDRYTRTATQRLLPPSWQLRGASSLSS
ncbi:ATP-dependent DNA helicase [Hydrocarboniphaga effusa]|uniref:ATP-dependent DNA helicase n=1 Tax=Hydrocarboniphaga effusa TaxID=243629 RepID=UPI00398BC7B2